MRVVFSFLVMLMLMVMIGWDFSSGAERVEGGWISGFSFSAWIGLGFLIDYVIYLHRTCF